MRCFDLSRKSLLVAAALSASLLSACNNAPESDGGSSDADTAVTPAMPAEQAATSDAAPVLPDHNYDEKRGWTYYYVAAISEEDRKKGRAAGAVVAFQYLGLNDDGRHVLANMNSNGTVNHEASCASPCRIIDLSYGGNMAYSSESIIGAAFEDAIRGKLKVADWAKDEIVKPMVAPVPASAPDAAEPPPPVDVPADEPWETVEPSDAAPSE